MTTRSLPYTRPGGTPTGDPTAGDLAPWLPDPREIMGRASGENFRVASRVLPRRARDGLLSVYGYARLVDEIGDSYEGDRLGMLEAVRSSLLEEIATGAGGTHPLIAGAAALARAGRIDRQHLLDLIDANRMDQTVTRYEDMGDLYAYCALSANPVGRMVLELFGALTPERAAWSDSVCTGLQLAEHWQDVTEDARAGRVYIPKADLRRFHVEESELAGDGPAGRNLRSLIAFESDRARRMLLDGEPLVRSVGGRLKLAVAGFIAGGHAALDAIAARGFDPLGSPPRPAAPSVLRHTLRELAGRR